MYLNAESVKVDTDEGAITLEIDADDGIRWTVNIHGIDLDAFYASVQSGVGGYLRERDEARRAFVCAPADVDESGGYDLSDPKHPDFHSVHADLYDNREGK
jgi:hypothetical protein